MTLINKFKLGLIGLVLGSSCKESMDNKFSKIIVDAGTFETGKGEFLSKNFYGCSAIIFDYGDSAIFSHAYRGTFDNVVNEILNECKRKKIIKENLSAYVFSGFSEDLKEICEEIIPKDIPIKKVLVYKKFEEPREIYNIEFNSLTNKYQINSSKLSQK